MSVEKRSSVKMRILSTVLICIVYDFGKAVTPVTSLIINGPSRYKCRYKVVTEPLHFRKQGPSCSSPCSASDAFGRSMRASLSCFSARAFSACAARSVLNYYGTTGPISVHPMPRVQLAFDPPLFFRGRATPPPLTRNTVTNVDIQLVNPNITRNKPVTKQPPPVTNQEIAHDSAAASGKCAKTTKRAGKP